MITLSVTANTSEQMTVVPRARKATAGLEARAGAQATGRAGERAPAARTIDSHAQLLMNNKYNDDRLFVENNLLSLNKES